MKIHCPGPNCGVKLKVSGEQAGRRGRCPNCGASFLIPLRFAVGERKVGIPLDRGGEPTDASLESRRARPQAGLGGPG
jgi:hypothetical protein